METQTETQRTNNNGQLIYVPHKDTIRLLEVYVKRSLSLNDGTLGDKKPKRKEKWVTMPRKQRRHSSDPSLHLADAFNDDSEVGTFSAVEAPANQPETNPEEPEKALKKSKKSKKKPSFWKSLLGFFSRKSNEEKDEEQDGPSDAPEVSQSEETSDSAATCLPTTPVALQKRKSTRRKSMKRRFSKKRLSLKKPNTPGKDLSAGDITRVEGKFDHDWIQ